jgi:hypothetical protein
MSVKKSKKMFALFLFMMNNPIELNRLLIQRRIKDDLKFKILDTIHSPYDAKIVEELHTRRPISTRQIIFPSW